MGAVWGRGKLNACDSVISRKVKTENKTYLLILRAKLDYGIATLESLTYYIRGQ